MKILKQELKIILNVLLHYKKYRKNVGKYCVVIDSENPYYGYIGYISDFEFTNLRYPIKVRMFPDKKAKETVERCFSLKEIEITG